MSFPLGRAWVCADVECSTVYDAAAHRACPRCQSTKTYPVERFFRDRDAEAHTRAVRTALHRLHVHVLRSA